MNVRIWPRHTVVALATAAACGVVDAQDDDARFAECQNLLKAAQQAQILDDIQPRGRGQAPRVLVGPHFFKLPLKSREGFSKALNCLLVAGARDKCMNFDLQHWQSGAVVARYENCVYKPR